MVTSRNEIDWEILLSKRIGRNESDEMIEIIERNNQVWSTFDFTAPTTTLGKVADTENQLMRYYFELVVWNRLVSLSNSE